MSEHQSIGEEIMRALKFSAAFGLGMAAALDFAPAVPSPNNSDAVVNTKSAEIPPSPG